MEDTDIGDLFLLNLPLYVSKPINPHKHNHPYLSLCLSLCPSTHKFLNLLVLTLENKFLILQGQLWFTQGRK